MKPRYIPLLTLACVAVWHAAFDASPVPQIVIPAVVRAVHDGDTVTAEVTVRLNVRLLDCWAPEVTGREKAEGLKSKARLTELVDGKQGVLTIPFGNDLGDSFTFGRVLGRLWIDGKDVSETMVAEKFATKEKVRK